MNSINIEYQDYIIDDLSLSSVGKYNANIYWTSSNTKIISNTGKVTRPKSGKGDKEVLLTATIEYNGMVYKKEFNLIVIENTTEKTLEVLGETYNLGQLDYQTDNISLDKSAGHGTTITWSSSNEQVIKLNGGITRPQAGNGSEQVTLTAKIELKGKYVEKDFEVTVPEEYTGYIMSYTLKGESNSDYSLHLAYSDDGETFYPLNNNKGIYLPSLELGKMKFPYLFRKPDGSFGLVASNNISSSSVLICDSKDLITFQDEYLLNLNTNGTIVGRVTCEYVQKKKQYVIHWMSGLRAYANLSNDLKVTDEASTTKLKLQEKYSELSFIDEAIIGGVIQVTQEEYEKILEAYQ